MRNSIMDIKDRRGEGEHPGLLLQRYLMCQASPDEQRNLYNAVMQAARSKSLYAVYEKAFERWQAFSSREQACRSEQLATPGRLIIGLGSTSVLETGLRLHHTYGVPIIPGSTLKGLASHYCHEVWGQRRVEMVAEENRLFRRSESHHKLLFGTTDDGGVITFHDAWLTPGSLSEKPLRLDVMTPHHPKSQTGQVPQTDFDSPVPVSFLSVAGTFDIRLAWAGPADTQPDKAESWAGLAMTLLKEALSEWGVGGKTGSGYGRLVAADKLGIEPTAGSSFRRKAQEENSPVYQRGECITVVRVEDPGGRGKVKFRADDGLLGHFSGEEPPEVEIGEIAEVWVANVSPQGYTLTRRQPKVGKI